MISVELHSGWTVRATAGEIPARIDGLDIPAEVPGSIHTDLIAANLIADPYLGMEEKALEWMHTSEWSYRTTFRAVPAADGEQIDLAFDGLDTVAWITLNGSEVARTANQHRQFRFNVTELVLDGDNQLEVHFSSALNYARAQAQSLGLRPRAYDHPFNMVRKMACSFGWDWGPDLQTAGIWKPVRLERWSVVRATSTRAFASVDNRGVGRVEVHMDLQWADEIGDDPAELVLEAAVSAAHGIEGVHAKVAVKAGSKSAVVILEVPKAPLWWPAGYGDQPLFELKAALRDHAVERSSYARRIGFRSVAVNTTPDQYGTPFTVSVNGVDVFIKGANWIPDDHLLTRITREQLEVRVDQALAAHMNLLRIWGGGVYESEDFYDVCDERGILVWQDFLLACAAYPQEPPFLEEFTAEARDNVARLTPHPSLIIWNGGNENLWGFVDWGWQADLEGDSWGLDLYTRVFADTVAELDPTRFYAEGSPYSPGYTKELSTGATRAHPNDQRHGTRHEWDVWNRQDHLTHLEYAPRFCSEFGHQGPPTWSTLTRAISPQGRFKVSAEFLLHQKAGDGNLKLDKGAAPHLPLPSDFEEWNWVTQLSQAHSVSFGIEHFRSFWPHTAGSIMWQLNDCWPVTSWSAVDGDGREKPLFYALAHAHAPRLMTFKPREETANATGIGKIVGAGHGAVTKALGAGFGEALPNGRGALGTPTLFIHNDTDLLWSGNLNLVRQTFNGQVLASNTMWVEVRPRTVQEVAVPQTLLESNNVHEEVLVANLGSVRAMHYFAEYKDLVLDPHPFEARVFARGHDVVLEVATSAHLLDFAVIADRVHPDLVVNDQLVTLLAGETAQFVISQRPELGRKQGIGAVAPKLAGPSEIVSALTSALADASREHTILRAVNTIRV